jgi:peptidoglycan-associated lipoprotein
MQGAAARAPQVHDPYGRTGSGHFCQEVSMIRSSHPLPALRSSLRLAALFVAPILLAAGCHKAPAVTPAPTAAPDNSAADRARADAERRARETAAAEAARRDAAARDEADRRARDAAAAEAARNALSAKIFFDFEKDSLRADAIATLDAKLPVLMAHPELHVRIEGNADDRGSDEYNLALGQRRSAAAKRYLAARGIDASRIDVVSFGEEKPVCKDEAESCWHQNRRDEFVITAGADRLASPR